MDKDHLVELISSSLIHDGKNSESLENLIEFKNYLQELSLDQLRTMSKSLFSSFKSNSRLISYKFQGKY